MKYHFEDEQEVEKVFQEAESWLGTPFKHKIGVKGLGTDCLHHCAGVLYNISAIPVNCAALFPDYAPDWHIHNEQSLVLQGVLDTGWFECFDYDINKLMSGDLILFKYGKAASHSGLYVRGYGYHSFTRYDNMKLRIDLRLPGNGKPMYICRLLAGDK